MPMDARDIETMIKAAIPDAEVTIRDLAGDGDHYAATVISESFRGKSRVQQHQEENHEHVKQQARDVRGRRRYAGEAEYAGDNRHQKEDQRPFQNCHRPLLQASKSSSFGPPIGGLAKSLI